MLAQVGVGVAEDSEEEPIACGLSAATAAAAAAAVAAAVAAAAGGVRGEAASEGLLLWDAREDTLRWLSPSASRSVSNMSRSI